jgi:hypothetical protein
MLSERLAMARRFCFEKTFGMLFVLNLEFKNSLMCFDTGKRTVFFRIQKVAPNFLCNFIRMRSRVAEMGVP